MQVVTADLDLLARQEDVAALIETAEPSGVVRHSELAELIETHQLDSLEVDALYRELEGRGIDVVEEKEPSPPPPPVVQHAAPWLV